MAHPRHIRTQQTGTRGRPWPGKTPPQDPMAEMSLLGAAILDPRVITEICVQAGGNPDFYSERHATIWRAMRDVHDTTGQLDLVLLVSRLGDRLPQIGGEDYLVELASAVPSAANWPHYLANTTIAARKRALLDACATTIHRIHEGAGIDEAVSYASDGVSRAAETRGGPRDLPIQDAARDVLADLEARRPSVLPTGLASFDEAYGGIPFPGVTTIMGVPMSGKSSLAAGIVLAAAKRGIPSRIVSFEMSGKSITANLLGAESGVCVNETLRTGHPLNPGELYRVSEAAEAWNPIDLAYIEDSLSARQIEQRAGLYAAKGVRVLLVDYIQNLPAGEAGQADVARIEEACRVMQRIARRFGMAVIMVSQMTGAAAREERAPRKSDGIGSAAIDQVSDMTIGIFRPCVFQPRSADETDNQWRARQQVAEIHVLKHKKGPIGMVHACWEGRYTRFTDAQDEYGSPASHNWTAPQGPSPFDAWAERKDLT